VLIHGWTSTAALTWQFCMAPLAEQFRVVAPDMRGHGRGIRSWRPFRLEDCADDVAGLVAALGAGPVIVVGYSMGGPVAQLVWRRHPEVVAGLVLCATATTFGRSAISGTLVAATAMSLGLAASTFPTIVRSAGMRRMARSTFPPGGSPEAGWAAQEWAAADPAGLLAAGSALLRYDSSPWIATVDVPTGVIVTTEDQTVYPDRQRRLAEAVPGAFSLKVPGGHRSCVEACEDFVPALVEACTRVAAAGYPGPERSARSTARAASATASP
jgi:pimeloyl-ACP methyl ester carboxylesterase